MLPKYSREGRALWAVRRTQAKMHGGKKMPKDIRCGWNMECWKVTDHFEAGHDE